MDTEIFKSLPLLGILRGIDSRAIKPLVKTIIQAGLKTIEITMNTENAPELIAKMVTEAQDDLCIGAGTVVSMDTLHAAIDAGASFIVSPVYVPDVVFYCHKNNIPVFPGAFTPQEIFTAWDGGATMVKVFPAGAVSPSYFKEIKGPFDHIELLACGGVTSENIASFFNNGASAVAFGGSIFKKEWIAAEDFNPIGKEIEALISSFLNRE